MSQIDNKSGKCHQVNLRKGRLSEKYATYSITKCVQNRCRILLDHPAPKVVLDSMDFFRSKDELKLLAFCIMPDHLHLLFTLTTAEKLSDLLKRMFRFTAVTLNKAWRKQGGFWQEGFFDHRCRDDDDVCERAEYIESNPVRANLCQVAADWPYSSAFPANKIYLDRGWYFG